MAETQSEPQPASSTPAASTQSGGSASSSSSPARPQLKRALQAKGFDAQTAMLTPGPAAPNVQRHSLGIATAAAQQAPAAEAVKAPPGPVQMMRARSVQRSASEGVVQREVPPGGGPPPGGPPPGGPPPGGPPAPNAAPNANAVPGGPPAPTNAAPPVDPAAELRARNQEVAGVTQPPIAQAPADPPANLGADGKSLDNMKSDSPDPILIKNRLIGLTTAYLNLQNPDAALKQTKIDEIKRVFEELRVAMMKARGEDQPLIALRVQFEKFVGEKATSEWTQGTSCVETMATTAKQMILAQEAPATQAGANIDQTLKNLPPDKQLELGTKLGLPVNVGFAGTVGHTFSKIVDTMTSGTLVQKCVALINFTDEYLIPGLLQLSGAVFDIAKANLAKVQPQLDLLKLATEAKTMDKKKRKAHLLTSPLFREKLAAAGASSGQANAKRQQENGGQALDPGATLDGMDTKAVALPVEVLSMAQLDFLAASISAKEYPNFVLANYRAQQGKDAKVAYLISQGITTTKPKGAMVDATSTVQGEDGVTEEQIIGTEQENYRYIEGKLENIVDPKNQWIMDATKASMPLKAGISGTTARFVGSANLLGGNMHGAVVAMIGHLQKIEAHSFKEIVDGAGLGVPNGSYVPFPPNDGGMRAAATQFIEQNGYQALGPMDKNLATKTLLGDRAG